MGERAGGPVGVLPTRSNSWTYCCSPSPNPARSTPTRCASPGCATSSRWDTTGPALDKFPLGLDTSAPELADNTQTIFYTSKVHSTHRQITLQIRLFGSECRSGPGLGSEELDWAGGWVYGDVGFGGGQPD